MPKLKKGFTLIELLVVIGIIALLSVVVFVALDPVKRFADARNATRYTDVNNILTAVHEYIVDNKGALPSGLTTSMAATQLGSCVSGGATLCTGAAAACVNIGTPLAKYLKSMPIDKGTGATASTSGYSVTVDANNIVTIKSCMAENAEVVEVSR
jgi:prepilin-type N-terminal cleavage/methylation domain-containing protein